MMESTGKADQRKLKGEKTREAIIGGALDLMLEQGRDGMTARNLATHVGISKAALFHHFDSMNEIVVASLERLFTKYTKIGAFPSKKEGPELALKMAQDSLANAETFENLFRATFGFLEDIMTNPELRVRLRDAFNSMVSVLDASIEKAYPNAIPTEMRQGIALSLGVLLDSLILYLMVLEDRGWS